MKLGLSPVEIGVAESAFSEYVLCHSPGGPSKCTAFFTFGLSCGEDFQKRRFRVGVLGRRIDFLGEVAPSVETEGVGPVIVSSDDL